MGTVTISVEGMTSLVSGLEAGLEDITDAKSSLQTTLSRYDVYSGRVFAIMPAARWAQAQLPGVRRRLAMAEALEGTNPAWPLGVVTFDEDDISTVDPATARRNGAAAAQALQDSRGVPDAELIAEILEMQNDPYFAAGLAAELTAEELAQLVVGLSHQRLPLDAVVGDGDAEAHNAWYADLITGLSGTLATATRNTGDLALPAGYAEQWVEAITAEVPTQGYGEGTGWYDHANALGVLLSQGRYGTSFLTTVADGVYEYERAYQEDHRGAVWAPRASESSWRTPVVNAAGEAFHDPLAGIMSALGNNPEAAQTFFTSGETTKLEMQGVEVEVSDRLKYLIQDRTWAVDPGEGGPLGRALESATTTFRDRTGTGRVSAEIASQAIAVIGEQTISDPGWEMHDGMRPHVAQILASYGADVHRVVAMGSSDPLASSWANLGSGSLFPDGMPYGLALDQDHLAAIVGTLGQDQENFTPFLTGVMQANNLAVSRGLGRALAEKGPEGAAMILNGGAVDFGSSSMTNSSTVLGWVLDTAYAGDKGDEEAEAARIEAIADAMSLASTLPFIPEIKPAWLQWGADQAQEQALEAYKGTAPSDAAVTYEELDTRAREDLTNATMNLMLQNGYFAPEVLGTSQVHIDPPPQEAIVTSPTGDPLRFDTDSRAYGEWFRNSAAITVMAESVVGVYADQWGVVR